MAGRLGIGGGGNSGRVTGEEGGGGGGSPIGRRSAGAAGASSPERARCGVRGLSRGNGRPLLHPFWALVSPRRCWLSFFLSFLSLFCLPTPRHLSSTCFMLGAQGRLVNILFITSLIMFSVLKKDDWHTCAVIILNYKLKHAGLYCEF